jgi:predicted Zn-dependent peptidase
VAGAFDPVAALAQIEATLGTLQRGRAAKLPAPAPVLRSQASVLERVSTEPQVMEAWRIPGGTHADARELEFGALLLQERADFVLGNRVWAAVQELPGEVQFFFSVTMPYDTDQEEVQREADYALRELTERDLAAETFLYTNLQLERQWLHRLDSLHGRVESLCEVDARVGPTGTVKAEAAAHWRLTPSSVPLRARQFLTKAQRITIHARPEHPRVQRGR